MIPPALPQFTPLCHMGVTVFSECHQMTTSGSSGLGRAQSTGVTCSSVGFQGAGEDLAFIRLARCQEFFASLLCIMS